MLKKVAKLLLWALGIAVVLITALLCYFFAGSATPAPEITWGVDFSQAQAESLGLNWKETYTAILQDLGANHIKLHTQWDLVEPLKSKYNFSDTDWQVKQAQQAGANIIYVLGLKSGRWPECHMPGWATNLPEAEQKQALLDYITATVNRYKDNPAITYWQVENEPLFYFGSCPNWYYKNTQFLKKEVALVKLLDPSRPVIVSDSGEGSLWLRAGAIGDVVGTTMYRESWIHISDGLGFRLHYFFSPVMYQRKAALIQTIFGKKVLCIELQAEPWTTKPFSQVPLEEQEKSMSLDILKSNVEFAKNSGLDTFYFWGPEWWFWLKESHQKPEIWNFAKELFQGNS